ncbi:MAG: hypothetical protein GXY14_04830 [Spirochaetes bacterium]|nr:hypothetical protein [Spirochaetota bacterium]
MSYVEKINHGSLKRLFLKFLSLLRGPFIIGVLRRTDQVFREKLLLVVSMSNMCGG